MQRLKVICFSILIISLSYAELLGPDSRKDKKKDEDESEESVDVKIENDLSSTVFPPEENRNDIMEYIEKLLEKGLTPNSLNLLQDSKLANLKENIGVEEDSPPDIMSKLGTLEEEEEVEKEPELTAEMQEAKQKFANAESMFKRRSSDLQTPMLLVKQAADVGYVPAKIKLAWSYLFGEGVEMDLKKGKEIFQELADDGVAEAHAGMGFIYAVGIETNVSQAKALVHYTMGAIGDSAYAQMALAYRYWTGVTVLSSCPKALDLYMRVATKVTKGVSYSGGPAIQKVRLLDEAEGGGTGATLDTDLIEYYQLLAEKGDVQAQVGLGQLHLQGGRGVTLDVNRALSYFQQAARAGNVVANAFLGKIYLEGGDGIKPDNETALRYFRKAAEQNNPVGQSGLGLMYLQGRGVPKDTTAAFKYFTMAANQGWVEGQLQLGFMYFNGVGVRRDYKQANKYFSLASQSGHVLALYHLAVMHARGLGVLRSCTTAVELLKNVCERGEWGARLMSAHGAWRARRPRHALLQYLALADAGYEIAQSNAAYILDNGESGPWEEGVRYARALQQWGRAAAQGCAAARVRLGNYHYYGLGTPQDLEAAAHHYRIASEQLHSAQATFNLGYMHERGLGLARDAHLAKRCYDLAADTAPEARLPAALALARLHALAALDSLYTSKVLSVLSSDGSVLLEWDSWVIAALMAALGVLVYLRRPAQVAPAPAP